MKGGDSKVKSVSPSTYTSAIALYLVFRSTADGGLINMSGVEWLSRSVPLSRAPSLSLRFADKLNGAMLPLRTASSGGLTR